MFFLLFKTLFILPPSPPLYLFFLFILLFTVHFPSPILSLSLRVFLSPKHSFSFFKYAFSVSLSLFFSHFFFDSHSPSQTFSPFFQICSLFNSLFHSSSHFFFDSLFLSNILSHFSNMRISISFPSIIILFAKNSVWVENHI